MQNRKCYPPQFTVFLYLLPRIKGDAVMEENDFALLYDLLEKGDLFALHEQLSKMNEVDIADFLTEVSDETQIMTIFRVLPKDLSADVFSYLEPEDQLRIVSSFSDAELYGLVDTLALDDVVDFLEEVPANIVSRVLSNTDQNTRRMINAFLRYPENSAGSIMTNEMVELHDRLTVAQAIEKIRSGGDDKETIYTAYIIDNGRHLTGTISLQDILLSDDNEYIKDIMDDQDQVISVHTLDDQEQVAEVVKKYDLLAVPVVDNEERLVGIVTIDDVIDIIEDEATEDFEKMAALVPSDELYLKTPVLTLVKNRIGWLLVLMISATLTSTIINSFESMLAVVTGLTASIPLITGTGGNAGTQSSTIAIRSLALGEITTKDYLKVVFKEFRVALICGAILAGVNFGRMVLFHVPGSMSVYFVTCLSMFFAVIVAKTVGCSLPMLAKLIKIDPAVMAGAMISTIDDALTLLIYFSLAKAFLL
jgi:magnesium transporter